MLKRFILGVIATLFFALQLPIDAALAVEIDPAYRTVKVSEQGATTTLSQEQVERGKRLFGDTCSQCHMAGRTKTNPNVTLSQASLEGAEPPRDSIVAIVDYLEHPTTYDGEQDLSEFHPNTNRADLYPEMRNLTQEDLENVAGFILVQPKILGIRWGGGKVYD
jgi:photosystem II cytochrome c550